MIRRGNLSSSERIAAWMLAIACLVPGTLSFFLGAFERVWWVSCLAAFVVALGVMYARAAILGRSLKWPRG
jgi:hypothetical protein